MKIDPKELQVKFKFTNKEEMLAQVTISAAQFELRGFRIMKTKFTENKNRFVLYPPAIKCGPRYMNLVQIVNKKDWEELQDFILKKFDEEYDKFYFDLFKEKNDKSNDISY